MEAKEQHRRGCAFECRTSRYLFVDLSRTRSRVLIDLGVRCAQLGQQTVDVQAGVHRCIGQRLRGDHRSDLNIVANGRCLNSFETRRTLPGDGLTRIGRRRIRIGAEQSVDDCRHDLVD